MAGSAGYHPVHWLSAQPLGAGLPSPYVRQLLPGVPPPHPALTLCHVPPWHCKGGPDVGLLYRLGALCTSQQHAS